ncbi:hypothetical protein [Paenibacillus pini]|uniref:Uncharacterized protein n=1 Tax=Paenibacillus pini JCM 16418 TaxID=1236976 RepID=W7YET9_9BACL|nr:hypothetical protein [Paenibacillus pini]GAF07032.1 hypothetical protein JCM16418_1019 [Paenibacillus pini JCM 16418]
MWIVENFYWILIVGFAIISALSKSGKSKQKNNPRGMPTFGGNGDRKERRSIEEERDDQNSNPDTGSVLYRSSQLDTSSGSSSFEEIDNRTFDSFPSGDYSTGEGVSQMWEDQEPKQETLEDRKRMMQRDIDKVNASLDRITSVMDAGSDTLEESKQHHISPLAEQARQGIIWSEILGPPRSKRSYNQRRN